MAFKNPFSKPKPISAWELEREIADLRKRLSEREIGVQCTSPAGLKPQTHCLEIVAMCHLRLSLRVDGMFETRGLNELQYLTKKLDLLLRLSETMDRMVENKHA